MLARLVAAEELSPASGLLSPRSSIHSHTCETVSPSPPWRGSTGPARAPECSSVPPPVAPMVPRAWASSTVSSAPWRSQTSRSSARGGHVPVHRVDAVDDDEPHAGAAGGEPPLLEVAGIVAAETHDVGAGELAAVDDAGVVELVDEHGVARPAHRAHHAGVRGVAGAEHHGRLAPGVPGHGPLQLLVQRDGTGRGAHAGGSGPEPFHGPHRGGPDRQQAGGGRRAREGGHGSPRWGVGTPTRPFAGPGRGVPTSRRNRCKRTASRCAAAERRRRGERGTGKPGRLPRPWGSRFPGGQRDR